MNPEAIFRLMDNRISMLSKKENDVALLGEEYVKSKREYAKEKAKKMFVLKNDKVPMAIIGDLVRGDKVISDLRFKRDLSKIKYEACKSEVYNIRLEIEVCRSKLAYLKEELKSV